MRKIRAILMLAFAFFSLAIIAAAQKAPAQDYFPLRVGDSWTYRTMPEPSEFTVKVLSEEKQPDGTIAYLLERKAGAQIHTWYSKANGFVNILREAYPEHEGMKMEYNEKPRLHLKIPLVSGEKWTWSGKSTTQVDMTESGSVVGLETVVVPAGTFKAMKVEVQISEGVGKLVRTFWYVDGVGLVKSRSESAQFKYGYELIDYSFKNATKATPVKKTSVKKPSARRRRPR